MQEVWDLARSGTNLCPFPPSSLHEKRLHLPGEQEGDLARVLWWGCLVGKGWLQRLW